MPVMREHGVEVRMFSGRSGNIKGPPRVSKYVPVTMLDVCLDGSNNSRGS